MNPKGIHKHRTVVTHAIRQRSGVPYEVERKVCTDCRRVLDERPLKRAAA
jgi:NMD protein affecting ribosome stability and mRNA decay